MKTLSPPARPGLDRTDAGVLPSPPNSASASVAVRVMAYPCQWCGRLFTAVRHLEHETGPGCAEPLILVELRARGLE